MRKQGHAPTSAVAIKLDIMCKDKDQVDLAYLESISKQLIRVREYENSIQSSLERNINIISV